MISISDFILQPAYPTWAPSKSHLPRSWSQIFLFLKFNHTGIKNVHANNFTVITDSEKKLIKNVKTPCDFPKQRHGLMARIPWSDRSEILVELYYFSLTPVCKNHGSENSRRTKDILIMNNNEDKWNNKLNTANCTFLFLLVPGVRGFKIDKHFKKLKIPAEHFWVTNLDRVNGRGLYRF